MRPSKKLELIADLAHTYQQRVPNATIDEMVHDPTIMAAIEDYEPTVRRALERAKQILRGAIILDKDELGRSQYVSVIQGVLTAADDDEPPISQLLQSYMPRSIAEVTPAARRAAAIRRGFKGVCTTMRNWYWMPPHQYQRIAELCAEIEAELLRENRESA